MNTYQEAHTYTRHKVGRWYIDVRPSGSSGWLVPDYSPDCNRYEPYSQGWIMYDDGRLAYDYPEQVPQYIQDWLERNATP